MNSQERIQESMERLAKTLPTPPSDTAWQSEILKSYQEPKRAYHNLQHISSFLHWIEKLKTSFHHPDWAEWAALYHDIIYVATRKDNESRSAAKAMKVLPRLGLNSHACQWVEQAILRTASHNGEGADGDTLLFLDCDLAILGSPRPEYVDYCRAIRREYRRIPLEMYRTGRKKVLEHFIQRPRVYFSSYFHEKCEDSARQNMEWEILELSKPTRKKRKE